MWPKFCRSNTQASLSETIMWTLSGVMILLDALIPQL